MTPEQERLAQIVSDAEGLGYLDPKYAEVMHAQVRDLQLDMMLELAAARHEIAALVEQRDATRRYLGVGLSPTEDAEGGDSAESVLRLEVKRVFDLFGSNMKIRMIKELRCSAVAAKAWEDLGNAGYDRLNARGPTPPGWRPAALGLKEAKDIIDAAATGVLYLGQKGTVPL